MTFYSEEEARHYWRQLDQNARRELVEEHATIRAFCIYPTGTIIDIATDEIYARDVFDELPDDDVEFYAFSYDGKWEGCSELLCETLSAAFDAVWHEVEVADDDDDDGRLSVAERVGSELRGLIYG